VDWIGCRVEVRDTKDKIEIQLDALRLVTHRRLVEAQHQRVTLAEHRRPAATDRGVAIIPIPKRRPSLRPCPSWLTMSPGLKQRSRKIVTLALRQLPRLVREYPRKQLLEAVREAAHLRLYDLDRAERTILRRVAR
jgi:hypothetical protein